MAPEQSSGQQRFVLPTLVFGLVEVRRLQRELETVAEYFEQNRLRGGQAEGMAFKISRLLDTLATENHINLERVAERQILANFLRDTIAQAPTVHLSFAADPSSAFVAKLVSWLRTNVHPFVLVQIGLQPSIAAGCIVRTSNRVFDFSLRQHLTAQRQLLTDSLGKGGTA